jgi:glycosyltransferase involved in cell wall biosynthesis
MPEIFYNAMVLREPYSGVEVTVHQLACALARYGSLRTCVCVPSGHRAIPIAPHVRLRTTCAAASRSRLLRIAWEQTVLPLLLLRARAPLLHAPAYVAPLLTPCPLVLTIHDLHVMTHPQFCRTRNILHYKLLIPPSVKKAAAIITFSSYVKNTVLTRFPAVREERIHVISPGLSQAMTHCTDHARLQAVRQRYDLPASFLLFVGDLTSRKNILSLIDAFAIVQSERPDLHLVLAGAADSATAAVIDAAIHQNGVRHRVSRTDYVSAEDLPVLYSLAQAFVFPSHDEGFGLPPIEAMACGCPVVCSGGAVLENCGTAAVTCDPSDRTSIASAVSLLLDQPAFREEKIEAGYRRAAEFTWEKSAHATEAVYRSVLDASASARQEIPT